MVRTSQPARSQVKAPESGLEPISGPVYLPRPPMQVYFTFR